MHVILAQSGGLKGAFQVPILAALAKDTPDLYAGVSAGSLNAVMAAQEDIDDLYKMWERVGDVAPWRWTGSLIDILEKVSLVLSGLIWQSRKGLYDLSELRTCIDERVSLSRLKTKFACGVVARETFTYHNLVSDAMKTDLDLHRALLASSAISGLFEPVDLFLDGDTVTCSDGGHLHPIPLIPKMYRNRVTSIDLVMTYPILHQKRSKNDVNGLWRSMEWALEISMNAAQIHGLRQIRHMAEQGVYVRIFSPDRHLGSLLDGSESTIKERMILGEAALKKPIIWDLT